MADFIAEAIEAGKKKAEEILDGRRAAQVRRAAALQGNSGAMAIRIQTSIAGGPESASEVQTAGFLAAVGDSWFDYPFHDVLKLLEDGYGYNIESTAHKGDPIEKIAYHGGQIDGFARKLEKIKARGAVPKAVLLSGGGDDVAGNEFGMLLNNAFSPIPGWNQDVVDGVLKDRIARAYVSLFSSLTSACQEYFKQTVPILVHGYDYPVPDGRGFLGGWPFPGPWLDPGFREKNFKLEDPNDLNRRVAMMKDVMDQLNVMLKSVTSDPALSYVHYIDLRGTLSNDLKDDAYKEWWANECIRPKRDLRRLHRNLRPNYGRCPRAPLNGAAVGLGVGGWPRLYSPAQPAPGVPHPCASFAQGGNHTDRTMGFAFHAACAPNERA